MELSTIRLLLLIVLGMMAANRPAEGALTYTIDNALTDIDTLAFDARWDGRAVVGSGTAQFAFINNPYDTVMRMRTLVTVPIDFFGANHLQILLNDLDSSIDISASRLIYVEYKTDGGVLSDPLALGDNPPYVIAPSASLMITRAPDGLGAHVVLNYHQFGVPEAPTNAALLGSAMAGLFAWRNCARQRKQLAAQFSPADDPGPPATH